MLNETLKLLLAMNIGITTLVMLLLLFSKPQIRAARNYLALLILVVALSLTSAYIGMTKGVLAHLNVGFLWIYTGWCIGPILFAYASVLTNPSSPKLLWPHFILPLSIFAISSTAAATQYKTSNVITFSGVYLLYGQIIIYGTLSVKKLLTHSNHVRMVLAEENGQSLRWLRYMTILYIFMWVLDLLTTTLNLLGVGPGFSVYGWYLWLESIFIIGLAIIALRQPKVLYSLIDIVQTEVTHKKGLKRQNPNYNDNKYQTSQFDKEISQQLKQQLDKLMLNDQPFLNNLLNLKMLADLLDVTPHQLSQLLNMTYGLNFYDFINKARVDNIQKMLANKSFQHLAIIDIAFQSGFNNKNTFNRAFRKHTGETPSTFRQSRV